MKIGVVIPIFNAFKDAVISLESIKTSYVWTPYIQPQWKTGWPLARAWNHGILDAVHELNDYVLILNDDAFVQDDTIDKLVETLEHTDNLLVSAVEMPGGTATNFSCFMIAPQIVDEVGTFDENFKPLYFEDNDFVYRMKLLGVEHMGVPDALFEHKGSQSLKIKRTLGQEQQHHEEFRANEAYYIKKWGGMPRHETYTTPFNNGGSVKEWTVE